MTRKRTNQATRTSGTNGFGATKANRIEILRTKVGPQGVKRAEKLLSEEDADVLRLVSLQLPSTLRWSPNKLGERVEGWLSNLPKEEASEIREKLMTAKKAVKTA